MELMIPDPTAEPMDGVKFLLLAYEEFATCLHQIPHRQRLIAPTEVDCQYSIKDFPSNATYSASKFPLKEARLLAFPLNRWLWCYGSWCRWRRALV
jgi:hypothetical protein